MHQSRSYSPFHSATAAAFPHSTLLLTVAMHKEAECLFAYAAEVKQIAAEPFPLYHCIIGKKSVLVVESGIGKSNAAAATAYSVVTLPRIKQILNVGVSGGLAHEIRVGDLLWARKFLYYDVWCGTGNLPGQIQGLPPYFKAEPEAETLLRPLSTLADTADGSAKPSLIGDFCTGDRFIPHRAKLRKIRDLYPRCIAVDMESAASAQVCYRLGVPFLSVRVVSDTPLSHHAHAMQYARFWQKHPQDHFNFIPPLIAQLSARP